MTLSVFSGGFTLAAAETVCDEKALSELSVLDAIERLASKSLLLAEHDGSSSRFRLLETIRQYAAEKLVDSAGADAARRRHFDYFVALAERAEPELRKANVLEWLDRLEAEHDNLRAALDWAADADAQGVARLAGALHRFWDARGYFVEGFDRLERAVALHTPKTPRDFAPCSAQALSRIDWTSVSTAPTCSMQPPNSRDIYPTRAAKPKRRCGVRAHSTPKVAITSSRWPKKA